MSEHTESTKDDQELYNTSRVKQLHHKLKEFKLTLPVALIIVILLASLIVGLGYWLYLNSDNQKYDLERPGQKQNNQALNIEDQEADTTSPVDASVAKRKIEYLQKEIGALKSMTDFPANDLSDQDIQLTPSEQPSR